MVENALLSLPDIITNLYSINDLYILRFFHSDALKFVKLVGSLAAKQTEEN
jgi:hypothetical protein